jgi:hypothetical protein
MKIQVIFFASLHHRNEKHFGDNAQQCLNYRYMNGINPFRRVWTG